MSAGATVGIDIGGTWARVGRRGRDGALIVERAPVPEQGTDLAALLVASVSRVAPEGVARVGVSAPGPLDFAAGIVNKLNKPGWRGYPLIPELAQRLGAPVEMDNDANCAALGEWRAGAGQDARTLVYYTISTGVGTGVVIEGRIHRGAHDTEGGHQIVQPGGAPCPCGSRGCLEAVASGTAIRARYGRAAEEIDDPAVWEEVAGFVALAINNTAMLLCPEVVVIGGGVSTQGERLLAPLRRQCAELIRMVPVPAIRLAGLGQDSGLVGALALAETITSAPG
ncbi:MAG TPA: ROK family protein [Thermomicrobiales bacterium]|nr:ROK family protein [Thermomicrobiales bacterium]